MPVDRFKLIAGPYQTPKFEYGDIVVDLWSVVNPFRAAVHVWSG